MSIRENIEDIAKTIGIDAIGITNSGSLDSTAKIFADCIGYGYIKKNPEYNEDFIFKITNPSSFLPEAKTVITAALFYFAEEENNTLPDVLCGTIAPYTRRNHYRALKKNLEKLSKQLKKIQPSASFYISSNGQIREKPLAQKSGLGYFGKNSIIITRDFGSLVVIGTIITDIVIENDQSAYNCCGDCSLCIDTCPTKAIVSPGIIDRTRCLQAISAEESLPVEYRKAWGNRLYGCSTCQDNCPVNKKMKPSVKKTHIGDIGASLPLIPLLSLNNEEIRTRFQNNPVTARWVSPWAIKKNAIIALGNIGNPYSVDILENLLYDSPDFIREQVCWSLKRIGGKKAMNILNNALSGMNCINIRNKIKTYLEQDL